ncbi:MAG TPA: hypothetical protein VK705_06080 [Ferruginibacter sp.]|jgi:hypothetical protein|nr:hypothetical protein [Ferruginibacter sp.]
MSNIFLDGFNPIPPSVPTKKGVKSKIKLQFKSISDLKPVFSYKYLSLNQSDFCYNNPQLDLLDFFELFKVKRELSALRFEEIEPINKYHFHHVKSNKKEVKELIKKFKVFVKNETGTDDYDLPEIYQFSVYTTDKKAPRVFGFLGKEGLFNIVWLDLNHDIYPKKKSVK